MELIVYTIFDHPSDYPDHFVVRREQIKKGLVEKDMEFIKLENTLEKARTHIPFGLCKMDRHPFDIPSIVETYI